MKKISGIFAGMTLLLMTSSLAQAAGLSALYFEPYVGVDAQFRYMPLRKNYGAREFRNRYPQGNLYVGFKFCDYLGFEGGYFASSELTKNSFFEPNEVNLAFNSPATLRSLGASRIEGWHINCVGYVPISDYYCLTALTYVGASNSKITLKYMVTETGGLPDDFTAKFSHTKTILRAGIGIQHMINNCIGVRTLVGWENTGKLNNIRTTVDPNIITKLRDSVLLSFGIFVKF